MSMNFKPTKSGGRVARGKTLHGNFYVEWNADGKLIASSIEIKYATVQCVNCGQATDAGVPNCTSCNAPQSKGCCGN